MSDGKIDNYCGGNIYNKYESRNPIVKIIMKKFIRDLDLFLETVEINTVLDAGCGEGYLTYHIKQLKNDLIIEGIDFFYEVIETAKSLHPEIQFSQGSIYELPYKNNSFDMVVTSEVLEHLEYPEKAIREITRVSRKYCLITVPNEPFFRLGNILRLKYLSALGNTPGHIQNWTLKSFNKLLNEHFTKVSLRTSTLWMIALCEK